MGTHNTLYRMKKMELQDCQQKKLELEGAIADLAQREQQLDKEMAEQNRLITEDSSYRMTYGLFFERYQKRKASCRQEQAMVNKELALLIDKMHEKFGDMKKMELLQQNQQEKRLSGEAYIENTLRDENTLIRVVRDELGLNS